jgi:hypothetical protein
LTNSGSPLSASTVVNANEYIHVIKEGQIRNYIWDVAAGAWVRDPGTIVNISGLVIDVDISGAAVEISGEVVNISGQPVKISGSWVTIASGNVATITSGTVFAKTSGEWTTVASGTITITGGSVIANISGSYIYPRETLAAYTSGMSLIVNTSATFVHIITAPQPAYYEYTAIKIGASAAISTNIITVYLTPSDSAPMSGTIITTKTLDSGTYNLYVGIPAAVPYYPLAMVSGDTVAINIPLLNCITGDAITVRTILKTV